MREMLVGAVRYRGTCQANQWVDQGPDQRPILSREAIVPSKASHTKIDIAISLVQVLHRVDGGNLWEPRNPASSPISSPSIFPIVSSVSIVFCLPPRHASARKKLESLRDACATGMPLNLHANHWTQVSNSAKAFTPVPMFHVGCNS